MGLKWAGNVLLGDAGTGVTGVTGVVVVVCWTCLRRSSHTFHARCVGVDL